MSILYRISFLECSPPEEMWYLFMFSMAALGEVTDASVTETLPQAIICCPPRFPITICISDCVCVFMKDLAIYFITDMTIFVEK